MFWAGRVTSSGSFRENVQVKVAVYLFVVLWLAGTIAIGQSADQRIEHSFRAGQQALQQGQFSSAVAEFRRVLALDPTVVEAEVNLGLAYQGLLDYESATAHLTKSLRERPNLLGPTIIVGMDYVKMGASAKAIPYLQHALKLDASSRDAHEALASAYLAKEDFGNAAEQFRAVADLTPDKSEAWFKLGHEYLDLAARLAYRGAHLYKESAWGHRFLGDLLLQRGRWRDAAEEYGKALAVEPKQLGLHASRGAAYLTGQKLDEAEADFRQELQLDARSEAAREGLTKVEAAKGQGGIEPEAGQQVANAVVGGAAEALAKLPGAKAENAEASYWLARTYLAQGAEAYTRLQESSPDSWRAHQLRAESYALRNDVESAIKEYQLALQLSPEQAELHGALGELYLEHHRDAGAAKELERAYALNPSHTRTLCALGRLYLRNQENERALTYLDRAMHLDPDLTEASSLLGTTYVRLGQFANAVPRLEKAAPFDHYGDVHYELYLAYKKLGKADLAGKALARSQELRRSSLERDQALVMGAPQTETEKP